MTGEPRTAGDADAALVSRILEGDRPAWAELVRKYQKPLYYLALRYLRNDADAADVVQRAFVRAYRSIAAFRGDGAGGSASLRSWLYRIAINLSLNHLRDNRRMQPSDTVADTLTCEPVGAGRVIAGERAEALRVAIAELPPKQRMVLELRIYDDLSFREVAELADCSENAAKVNFHHAVKKLRALLTAEPGTTR